MGEMLGFVHLGIQQVYWTENVLFCFGFLFFMWMF